MTKDNQTITGEGDTLEEARASIAERITKLELIMENRPNEQSVKSCH